MKFSHPTILGKILKRYKRFLADIQLPSGEIVQAHVPNTGSMTKCWEPDWKCLVTHNTDPKRKLRYTLEMTHDGKTWIGVNTSSTNKIAKEAILAKKIKELSSFEELKAEVKYGQSRLDFCLIEGEQKTFVEVKNVTLIEKKTYQFPDAVSTRGQKHLKELIQINQEKNHQAVMLFIIQRTDGNSFTPAQSIDPEYTRLLQEAQLAGVQILAYECQLSETEISLAKPVKVVL